MEMRLCIIDFQLQFELNCMYYAMMAEIREKAKEEKNQFQLIFQSEIFTFPCLPPPSAHSEAGSWENLI